MNEFNVRTVLTYKGEEFNIGDVVTIKYLYECTKTSNKNEEIFHIETGRITCIDRESVLIDSSRDMQSRRIRISYINITSITK